MRNEIKISFMEPEFYVDSKNEVTSCKLTFEPQYPPFIKFVLNNLSKRFTGKMTVIAKTRSKNNDVFSQKNGYQVALAKAENKAYRTVRNILRDVQEYLKLSDWQISDFTDKVGRVVEHNIDFMRKF